MGHLSPSDSQKGPGGRAPLPGTPKYILSKALEMGVCFHRALILGNMEGCSFLRIFEKRKKKILFRGIFMRVLSDKQKCPVNGYLSP